MPESKDRNYYLVRSLGQSAESFKLFFERNVVAVGWSRVRFSDFQNSEDVVHAVATEYLQPEKVDRRVEGIKKNEVRRFLAMEGKDRLVIPYGSSIRLATVESDVFYEADALSLDLANQRRVKYVAGPGESILTIDRNRLSEALQRRLRVRGATVRDLVEFRNEIDLLFDGGDVRTADDDTELAQRQSFQDELLGRIQRGETMLAAGGSGLEHLVVALLETEGFTAEVLSKRTFKGFADADV